MTLQRIIHVTVNDFRIWNGENQWNLVDGMNVLYGPNGTGKTSLWEAIVAGLLDKHTGIHNVRRRVKGTSDKPKVEIDFMVDGTVYRIYKEFGKTRPQSQATLSVNDDGWVWLTGEKKHTWRLIPYDKDQFMIKVWKPEVHVLQDSSNLWFGQALPGRPFRLRPTY